MNAQQQLAELNSRECSNLDESQGLRIDRAIWLAKHGPAIAELIEACDEFVSDIELLSHRRIARAIIKLTEPK